MWEKKDALDATADPNNLHDVDNTYYWDPNKPPTIWDWIAQVNAESGTGFAGYNDWRVPEANQDGGVEELETIVDCGFGPPCIDPVFGPTASSRYWSSVPYAFYPTWIWNVDFSNGSVQYNSGENYQFEVRAVRGP
jgi:hypothetical protein